MLSAPPLRCVKVGMGKMLPDEADAFSFQTKTDAELLTWSASENAFGPRTRFRYEVSSFVSRRLEEARKTAKSASLSR